MPLGVLVLSPDSVQDIGLRRVEKLSDNGHTPVLKILKYKTVNYRMQVSERASRTCQDKIGR